MKLVDRILGCLFGGAIGDAFGSAYEGYSPPIDFTHPREWQISDDTQLTLATCEGIIEAGGVVAPAAIAARFAVWHRQRRVTGMGASTFKALTELVAGGHWALVGRKGERAAGNGAAMRIAPLAFFLDPLDLSARQTIRDVSRITHHHEEAYAGALAVVVAVRAAFGGAWDGSQNLLELVAASLPDTSVRDRLLAMTELDTSLSDLANEFGSTGYVVESVPLALYGAQQIGIIGFEAMLRELISVGGDTDTIASVAGQIAGAKLGYLELPQAMIERLPQRELIQQTAERLAIC